MVEECRDRRGREIEKLKKEWRSYPTTGKNSAEPVFDRFDDLKRVDEGSDLHSIRICICIGFEFGGRVEGRVRSFGRRLAVGYDWELTMHKITCLLGSRVPRATNR